MAGDRGSGQVAGTPQGTAGGHRQISVGRQGDAGVQACQPTATAPGGRLAAHHAYSDAVALHGPGALTGLHQLPCPLGRVELGGQVHHPPRRLRRRDHALRMVAERLGWEGFTRRCRCLGLRVSTGPGGHRLNGSQRVGRHALVDVYAVDLGAVDDVRGAVGDGVVLVLIGVGVRG